MKRKRNWKAFYQRERVAMSGEILRQAAAHEGHSPRVMELAGIMARGGVLSFPHTFLRDNLANYLDICAALYKSGRTNLVYLGVLHSNDERAIKKEFSLDNFEHVLKAYRQSRGLLTLPVRTKVFPLPALGVMVSDEWSKYLKHLRALKEDVRSVCTPGTAVLATGDPCHYGHGYAAFHPVPLPVEQRPEQMLKTRIQDALATLFEDNYYWNFVLKSRELLSDQTSVAILISELLGPKAKHRIFDLKFSDYSVTLSAKQPTLVASVLYSVSPK